MKLANIVAFDCGYALDGSTAFKIVVKGAFGLSSDNKSGFDSRAA